LLQAHYFWSDGAAVSPASSVLFIYNLSMLRPLLSWDVMWCRLVVGYLHFRVVCWSYRQWTCGPLKEGLMGHPEMLVRSYHYHPMLC